MNLKRIIILLGKELIYGSKSFLFIWILVAPILITLLFSLIFGTLFREKPRLGIFDLGTSQLVEMAKTTDSLSLKLYNNQVDLKKAVEKGVIDFGLILPPDYDNSLITGERVELQVYTWGQSLAKNRMILGVTIANLSRKISGIESPLKIETIALGDTKSIPWEDRILPFIVLMAVFLGGVFLPATSLIEEKIKGTIQAVIVTPITTTEIIIAKGLLGVIISMLMGIIILFLNNAFGNQPLLLLTLLLLGAIMAATISLMLGTLIKDFTTLFSVWKSGGILLFFPALAYIFPQIPQWLSKLFPTYYLITPIVEVIQKGAGWQEAWLNMTVLSGVDVLLIVILLVIIKVKNPFTA